MKEFKISFDRIDKYAKTIGDLHFFNNLSAKALRNLIPMMTEVYISGGEMLMKEGDEDNSLYILIFGRLLVKKEAVHERCEAPVAEVCPGEVVGEISLMTGNSRTATVYAKRDSILLKLSKEQFDEFERQNLFSAFKIAKASLKRLTEKKKASLPGQNIRAITVAPAGDSDHIEFSQTLYRKLKAKHSVILVDHKACAEFFQEKVLKIDFDSADTYKLLGWIQSLEEQYEYVIFVTDKQMTPWSALCIREADHILFVADSQVHPALNSIEIIHFQDDSEEKSSCDLIFIHPEDTQQIHGTKDWLRDRSGCGFHHMKMKQDQHWDKIVRILTNSAIGLVLNGGGAKGFAHIGVLQALEEHNIPVDYIAGVSVGAVIAACYLVSGLEEGKKYAADFGKNYSHDYTLPYISLLKGERLTKFYQDWYKDVRIEDLWTSFFCPVCNLTKGTLTICDQGELWLAVRMTSSLPAVFPPIFIDNEMYVDGGVMNNMPVDVMRKKMHGGKIFAVNCFADYERKSVQAYEGPFVSGWELFLKSYFEPKELKNKQDDIVSVTMSAISLASNDHEKVFSRMADHFIQIETGMYDLLDFRHDKEIIQLGYEAAIKYLKKNNL